MFYLESFKKHLKRKGKKDSVIDRNIRTVNQFFYYLKSDVDTDVSTEDIEAYIEAIEKEGQSAKSFLYVMMNYFRYTEDEDMYSYVAELREERTSKSRRKFQIKDLLETDKEAVRKLNSVGIRDVDQVLELCKTKEQRSQLAHELNISEDSILEIVHLSDLTRLGYVKRKLSRLYYDSGFRSPVEVAEYTPERLYEHFKSYVHDSGWDGMVPNPKDLENNIKNAKSLDDIVE